MHDAPEQVTAMGADQAWHGQFRIRHGNVLQRLGLALQDCVTLGRLADLEHGTAAAGLGDAIVLVAFALER